MSLKQERLDMILQREISNILQFDLKNPKLGFVTVTDVQCSKDLSVAKIYVSFLGKQERNDAGLRVLDHSKGYIRSELAKRLSIRKTPNLVFLQDKSLDRGNRIEKILHHLEEE